MSERKSPADDAAMADILASIRRIVTEEEKRVAATSPAPPGPQSDVLHLTEEMKVGAAKAPEALEAPAETVGSAGPPPPAADGPPAAERQAPPAPSDAAVASAEIEMDLRDLPVDEAQIADIVRAVLREELRGDLGKAITRKIHEISREEIARAFEDFAAEE
jgi:hypothetical protein